MITATSKVSFTRLVTKLSVCEFIRIGEALKSIDLLLIQREKVCLLTRNPGLQIPSKCRISLFNSNGLARPSALPKPELKRNQILIRKLIIQFKSNLFTSIAALHRLFGADLQIRSKFALSPANWQVSQTFGP